MHNAPSVVYPVGRSAWMGHALVVLGLLTLVTALVAAFTMEAARQTWFAPLLVLWLGWCAWAWRQWRRSPAGWLRWQADGRAQPDAVAGLWCWQHDRAAAGIELLLESADTAAPAALPTMSFGNWGVDPLLLAEGIKPGDDFNAYVNKRWIDATPLPADFSRIGAFVLLGEKSTYDVKALMDELVAKDAASLSGDERRILDTYRTYLDTSAIEAAGLAPAQPWLAPPAWPCWAPTPAPTSAGRFSKSTAGVC